MFNKNIFMIKYNGNNINKWLKGTSQVNKVYKGEVSCYPDITNDAPTPPTHDYSADYLTFRALEDGTFSFTNSGMSYSLDSGSTWTTLESGASTTTVSSGNTILWKAELTPETSVGIGAYSSTGQFEAEGNIMSLLFGDNFIGETDLSGKSYAFIRLFQSCSGLTSAENLILPATTLTSYCYEYMFRNCTSLTTAPSLPATALTGYCYAYMFSNCSSLTEAPSLPATTLTSNCYNQMFYGCTSLSAVTCLATDISASNCTSNFLRNVSSTGTFTKAASMTSWTIGNKGIPSGWDVVDYTS